MSTLNVDKVDPSTGTALEIGSSGDTVTVPSGATLTLTSATLNLPTTITSTTEVKTNKVSPATGTDFALGDSGDTFTVPSGATIDNLGTATGIWYDDNQVQSNIAVLGFKVAVNGSLVKYDLVDQAIDEYEDASGVDASASTNETRDASGKYYSGSGTASVTVSGNYDDSGTDGDYSWYKWTTVTASGTYTTDVAQNYEYLVVGGGGGGGAGSGNSSAGVGGGGAGGFRGNAAYDFAVAATTISSITVGDGGTGAAYNADSASALAGANGSDSVFSTITSTGGGGGATRGVPSHAAGDGGSGGGGFWTPSTYTGSGNTPSTTPSQGNDGGDGEISGYSGAGGGGAGAVGANYVSVSQGGAGGAGSASDIIETGTDVTYAGGGGGGSANQAGGTGGAGGSGGGGTGGGNSTSLTTTGGTDGLGGGGGSGSAGNFNSGANAVGGDGGSGIVIIRRLTSPTIVEDMTLQSNDTSAEAEPDNSDMVMLIENAAGTATLNTDIKGYISRDSGSNFTQGTLVDEGSWGTNKKILAFHDLDISGQPSGTSMCYKIETLNQSASKETRIYATSIGWR